MSNIINTEDVEQPIDYSKELFCPMYWYAGDAICDPAIRYVFAYGGASASKTYSIVQKLLTEVMEKEVDVIVMRKFSSDIDRSIYKDFKLVVKNWGLEDFFTFQKLKIKCVNGAVIEFTGLDDPEKIKGITGFTYAVMEEFNQFDFEDFKQMRNRMRGLPNQTIICIWNPIDELHWVKQDVLDHWKWNKYHIKDRPKAGIPRAIQGYVDKLNIQTSSINEEGNAVLLHTNYKDNWYISGHPHYPYDRDNAKQGRYGFFDIHQIDNFEHLKSTDYDYYRVYALGLWGRADRGDEFYKTFTPERIVRSSNVIYNDITMPLHITFDENVNPYLSLCIWQAAGRTARLIGEICNEHPKNTLDRTLMDFYQQYRPVQGNKVVYLYGDATSKKEDVKQEKGKDFYTIIEHTLRSYGYEVHRRVPKRNPAIQIRGGFINKIFSKNGFESIDIKVSDACKRSLEDWMYVKEAPDGTKFKKMVKDPVTEVRYQERGHTSDANDYFLLEYFKRDFQLYLTGSKAYQPTFIPRVSKIKY